jgi:hypothetical protein
MSYGTSVVTTGATVTTVTQPSGLTNGDIVLVSFSSDFTGITWGTPTGWTLLAGPTAITTDEQTIALYGCIYDGTQSWVWTPNGGSDQMAIAARWTGRLTTSLASAVTVVATTPVEGSNTSIVLTGATAASGDDIAAFSMLDTNGGTVTQTPPGSYTERVDQTNGFTSCSLATRDNVSAGATGNLTFTASAGTAYSGWVVRLATANVGVLLDVVGYPYSPFLN